MDIIEMHREFRALGQQMGMQLVRAILPESIDIYLNDCIVEWVRKRVAANVDSIYNDRVTVQRNGIDPVNGVRTLFKNKKVFVVGSVGDNGSYLVALQSVNDVMFYTSFDVNYITDELYYGCRFIEREKLYSTLRDYCNAASHEYPIISIHSDDNDEEVAEVHVGNGGAIKILNVNYIKMPNVVKYSNNIANQVNCNLPEYCHHEVVEMAVNKYFQSVNSTNNTVSAQ